VQKFDKDGDGKLGPAERKAAKEKLQAHRAALAQKVDKNGDGKVSPAERKAAGEKLQALRAAILKNFDKDGRRQAQPRRVEHRQAGPPGAGEDPSGGPRPEPSDRTQTPHQSKRPAR